MQRRRRTARTLLGLGIVAAGLALATTVGARATIGPENLQDPTISGAAIVGRTLTATTGVWNGVGNTYRFQWLRCKAEPASDSSSATCSNISGATTSAYELTQSDLNRRIRVRVTADNKQGKSAATSAPTSVVTTEGGKPANSSAPSISGAAVVGSALQASTGAWVGDAPIVFSYRWARCDAAGNACTALNATKATYTVVKADTGRTIRVRVTAQNSRGTGDAFSNQTDVVKDPGGGDQGVIDLPNGEKSVDVRDIPRDQRLIVDRVVFQPNPLTNPTGPISVRIRVKDTRGNVVRNAIVFIRSTPLLTSSGDNFPTATDGWVGYQLVPRQPLQLRTGFSIQFFAKAYRKGDPTLAGVSGTRLVQVATQG